MQLNCLFMSKETRSNGKSDNDIRKSNMKDQCSFSYEKICLNMLQFLRTYFDMYQGKKLTSCLNASCSEMINI